MANYRPLEILMIEDNEGDIELTKIAFEEAGLKCNIFAVYNGEEGMAYLHREKEFYNVKTPDLVLLDINMPRMDGKELLDNIKSDPALKAIPVIMLTSSGSKSDVVDCYRRHANSYIVKPTGMEKLIDMAKQIDQFWGNLAALPAV